MKTVHWRTHYINSSQSGRSLRSLFLPETYWEVLPPSASFLIFFISLERDRLLASFPGSRGASLDCVCVSRARAEDSSETLRFKIPIRAPSCCAVCHFWLLFDKTWRLRPRFASELLCKTEKKISNMNFFVLFHHLSFFGSTFWCCPPWLIPEALWEFDLGSHYAQHLNKGNTHPLKWRSKEVQEGWNWEKKKHFDWIF